MKHPTPAESGRRAFGLYLHWPFCQYKCPYCDFNSHAVTQIDQPAWREAYLRDLDRASVETAGRTIDSIFFGGGTPSLMDPGTMAAIIERIRRNWIVPDSAEITLEANPGSVEVRRFTGYRDAGVNRVSIGVQSLRDDALRRLGRLHSVAEARAAIDIGRHVFDNVSFDLIYARQDQSLADWEEELTEALRLSSGHLSLYQLTIEPGTAFGDRHARGKLPGLPSEDLSADLFEFTQVLCEGWGLPAYEISNHARPGLESVHNRVYWTAGDYLGIGPGAHGRLTLGGGRWATETVRLPAAWLAGVQAGDPIETRLMLSRAEQADEFILMGLRLREGIEMSRLKSLCGAEFDLRPLTHLLELGLLEIDGDCLRATRSGRPLLNGLITHVSAAVRLEAPE